jgi:hypothetical protein
MILRFILASPLLFMVYPPPNKELGEGEREKKSWLGIGYIPKTKGGSMQKSRDRPRSHSDKKLTNPIQ